MLPKTFWLTLRVLSLLLACLCVTVWKLPTVFCQQRVLNVVLLGSPEIDIAVGPGSLHMNLFDPEPRTDLTNLTIDLALAWGKLRPEIRALWIEWLAKTAGPAHSDPSRLEFFRDIAAKSLSSKELEKIAKAIQLHSDAIGTDDSNLSGDYLLCGRGPYNRLPSSQISNKAMAFAGFGILIFAIFLHHLSNHLALNKLKLRLGSGPNP